MKPSNFWSEKIRWQAAGEGQPAADQAPTPDAPAAPAADAPDYSFLPADFIVDGKPDTARFAEHYAELTKAPEVPEAYEFAVPKDLKFEGLPEGMAIEIDPKDPVMAPLFGELSDFLKGVKAPAAAAAAVSGMLAKYEATKLAQAFKEQEAELASLGPQAAARIANVTRLMEASLPAEQVKALQGVTRSGLALQALEKLLTPRGLQSPAPSPGEASGVDADLRDYYSKPTR